jgi:hypothetical protein
MRCKAPVRFLGEATLATAPPYPTPLDTRCSHCNAIGMAVKQQPGQPKSRPPSIRFSPASPALLGLLPELSLTKEIARAVQLLVN